MNLSNEKHNNNSFYKLAYLVLATLPLVFILVFVLSRRDVLGAEKEQQEMPNHNLKSPFSDELEPIYSTPIRLLISSIDLKADVVPVGVTQEGQLETPETWVEVGWYKGGAYSGQERNIIINGHFDKVGGAPAVFYNLAKVSVGDIVEIADNYGRIFSYEVIESTYVDINDPNRLDVLQDSQGKATLTLVTCGGVWTIDGYNKRLVVSAELLDNVN